MYIDESGDLGKYGSKYFSIAAIVIDNPTSLSRIIKKLRQRKLKKKIKKLPEIKANNSTHVLRKYVLDKLIKTDCEIYAIVVNKDAIVNYLFSVKDKLYNYLCGILMENIKNADGKLVIVIDKKHTNTLVKNDFNKYIENKLKSRNIKLEIEIEHKFSYSSNELQVIDFVVWSINRKFNTGDDSYYKIIEEKIANKDSMILWK